MMKTMISIIIPIYNSEKYLPNLFKSIDNQKIDNYEVILVNDGSVDNSELICKKYCLKNKRVRYFYKKNSGVSDTRNFGIKKAKGEYICFVDSDDIINSNYLYDFVLNVDTYSEDLICCGIKKESNIISHNYLSSENHNNSLIIFEGNEKFSLFYSKFGGFACNKLFKRSIIINNSISFSKDISMCEDKLFIFNYLKYCKYVKCINNDNYIYRITSTSASKNMKNSKWFSIYKVFDEILKYKKIYNSSFYKKESFLYCYYLYKGKYRLSFIKNNGDFNSIKKEVNNRIFNLKTRNFNFNYLQKIKLFLYKHFNKFIFFVDEIKNKKI